MKIALIHEFLTQIGGAEKVLESFHEIFPEAPVYVLVYDRGKTGDFFRNCDIKTSFIQRLPFGLKKFRWYFWLMPKAVESFDLSGYDVVLSDSSAYAKGAGGGLKTLKSLKALKTLKSLKSLKSRKVLKSLKSLKPPHICYCHTPTRYLWSDRDYVGQMAGGKLKALALSPVLSLLRKWDLKAAGRVDEFIANSRFVAQRIKKYYGRESAVIYPPVDTEKFYLSPETEDYYLIISRLKSYKKTDLVIQAFNELGLPLKIIGAGEDEERLRRMAKSNIEFLGRVSDEKKVEYLSKCRALIHPQTEDFGITAVEAMASGRPVIAFKEGGALETVVEGVTGVFFAKQTPEALVGAVKNFQPEKFNPAKIRAHALKFGKERFKKEISDFIDTALRKKGI